MRVLELQKLCPGRSRFIKGILHVTPRPAYIRTEIHTKIHIHILSIRTLYTFSIIYYIIDITNGLLIESICEHIEVMLCRHFGSSEQLQIYTKHL